MGRCKRQNKILKTSNYEMSKTRKMMRKLLRKDIKSQRNTSYRHNHENISRKELISFAENRIHTRKAVRNAKCIKNKDQSIQKPEESSLMDDIIIRQLEKNLKLRKSKEKSIPKMFVTDGLDYILEACNMVSSQPAVDAEFAAKKEKHSVVEISDYENRGNCSKEMCSAKKFMEKQKSKQEDVKPARNQVFRHVIENLKTNGDAQTKVSQEAIVKNTEMEWHSSEIVEAASQNITVQKESEVLEKQIKGLLNRLTEDNVKGITDKFEELYMSHSHNAVNNIFVSVLMQSLVRHIGSPEELVAAHAVFIAILHTNIGDAIGALILEALAFKFSYLLEHKVRDKQLDNITILFCHLYNLKVTDATVMYDILRKLAETFMEKEVELIILVLKMVGVSLRKEDPEAYRGLILVVKRKAQESALSCSSRLKFLCDILLSVKNNNVHKIPGYDSRHMDRLKKLLKRLVRQNVPQLRFLLKDLLTCEKRGRWWETSAVATFGNQMERCQMHHSDKLVKLAKKQGMNTELRKQIFFILMTSEDFLDAYGKIIAMKMKSGQEREVMYVIMHCCLQEKVFNKYYAYVAKQLCEFDRKFRMAVYFSVWDKLKQLENMSYFQRHNLSRFLSSLVLQKCLTLSVLKVIDFVTLDKVCISFIQEVLSEVLLVDSEETFSEIFKSITLSPKLVTFCKGLHLFMCHFFEHDAKAREKTFPRVKMAISILAVPNSKLRHSVFNMMATAFQKNGIETLVNGNTVHVGATNSETCVDTSSASNTTVSESPPEAEAPEIDIVINNVVCSFSVRCHLNLRQIALHGANVEYRRENGMITMKLRKPYTTASMWSSGKVTCTGATSEEQAKVAARRFARCLQKLGFKVRFNNFRVVNVLGTCSMPFAIKITAFSARYKEADYEPELHPGVTYKLKEPKATLKIFSTGSITVTAPSVADVQAAIEHIFPLVYEFRKERTKEDLQALEIRRKGLKRKRNFAHIEIEDNDFEEELYIVSDEDDEEAFDSEKSWE